MGDVVTGVLGSGEGVGGAGVCVVEGSGEGVATGAATVVVSVLDGVGAPSAKAGDTPLSPSATSAVTATAMVVVFGGRILGMPFSSGWVASAGLLMF
ncbi:MAG: hypothetical protein EOT05_02965 [Candidatus Microsaccharimonas sossegonensis]|uniref:Uncharacterized protein n=1 Tax=Candidatus Microsaccharimonas sossegonensis TaxID=2506948 RepID=A0A4Q0AHU1_9BACT|nr:MAG: hypothetical protein EOT05_02965 [Candidatus Microsaccharimonas sossegonensis]